MATELISQFKEAAQSITTARRPWRDFFDLSAVDLPFSIADATTRITQNLTHFRVNYSIIIIIALLVTLIRHPFALVAMLVVLAAWFFLYFSRGGDVPLQIFNFPVDDGIVAVLLIGLTIATLVFTGVFLESLVGIGIASGFVVLHALTRTTDDLVMDDLESPYGPMLSGQDSSRGDYTGI